MKAWNLISLTEARRLAVEALAAAPRQTEQVGLRQALGRIAACDMVNAEDNPAFDRSTVDGYAVRSQDLAAASAVTPVSLRLVGEVRMGRGYDGKISTGEAVRIPTGGMLPDGADAVLMQEYTAVGVAETVLAGRSVTSRENMVVRGDDVTAGTVVLAAGSKIGVPDLGVLASCGFARVPVIKKPVVTVVTTGDEIIPPEATPLPGQIRDVNSFTLAALAELAGCEVIQAERVADSQAGLTSVLQAALATSDLILVSGGSSVGDRDYTTVAVESLPGARTLFHGVALKPGKPTLLAMVGHTALFGIPGHTVAAMTVFHEIVKPALAARQGMQADNGHFVIQAQLGSELRPDAERDEIFRVWLEQTESGVIAWPLPAKSGLVTVMTRAHGMVYLPAGHAKLAAGDPVDVQLLVERLGGNWQGRVR